MFRSFSSPYVLLTNKQPQKAVSAHPSQGSQHKIISPLSIPSENYPKHHVSLLNPTPILPMFHLHHGASLGKYSTTNVKKKYKKYA